MRSRDRKKYLLQVIAGMLAKAAAKAEEFGDMVAAEKVSPALAESIELTLDERVPQPSGRMLATAGDPLRNLLNALIWLCASSTRDGSSLCWRT